MSRIRSTTLPPLRVEEALEAEVSDALGRGYYERGSEPGRGYRNGAGF